MRSPIKAVLFDVGGVVHDYVDRQVYGQKVKQILGDPELLGLFERFECGQVAVEQVPDQVLQQLGMERPNGAGRGESALAKTIGPKNAIVERAICSLRSSGRYTLALLTNNGFWDVARTRSTLVPNCGEGFDLVIESCRLGSRKPHAQFYQTALHKIGLSAEQCVFIDDLEANCEGAEAVGIRSIWLRDGDAKAAMEQLEVLLGEKLL